MYWMKVRQQCKLHCGLVQQYIKGGYRRWGEACEVKVVKYVQENVEKAAKSCSVLRVECREKAQRMTNDKLTTSLTLFFPIYI